MIADSSGFGDDSEARVSQLRALQEVGFSSKHSE